MKIAIVGGGIAGLMAGFMATEAGHGVTVFEKGRIGSGASGKALGLLVPITGLNRPVDALQREGIAAWPELCARLSGFGFRCEDFFREWGDGRYQVRVPMIFEVLRRGIEALGGEVREGTAVETPALLRGEFDRVVLAAGWGNAGFGQAMRVSAGIGIRYEVSGIRELVAGDNLFVVPDWDGTVMAGSLNWDLKAPEDGVVPPNKLAELVRRVGLLVPELREAEVIGAWVGYRPTQAPRLPLLRDCGDGIVAVAGLGKTGLGLSPLLKVWE